MSVGTQNSSTYPELRTGPLIAGAILVGAGSVIALAGIAVGGSHVVSATRQWARAMEPPPRELAKLQWAKAKTAAAAGTAAWQHGASTPQVTDA
jgi:hypothetical protein